MQNIVNAIISVVLVIVFATLVMALYTTYQCVVPLEIDQINPQNLRLLPAIAISSGVLIAILTWFREKSKLRIDQDRHTSEIMLDRVKDGFKTTVLLLSDHYCPVKEKGAPLKSPSPLSCGKIAVLETAIFQTGLRHETF